MGIPEQILDSMLWHRRQLTVVISFTHYDQKSFFSGVTFNGLKNETNKLLWDFEIKTDHLISARRPGQVIVNKKQTKKKPKTKQKNKKQKKNKENLPKCRLCRPGKLQSEN